MGERVGIAGRVWGGLGDGGNPKRELSVNRAVNKESEGR
jgi:hypothetical protein